MSNGNLSSTFWKAVRGPIMLIVLGTLFVVDHADSLKFSRTWPLLLVTFGIFKLLERQAAASEPQAAMPQAGYTAPNYTTPGYTPGGYNQGSYGAGTGGYQAGSGGPSWWGAEGNRPPAVTSQPVTSQPVSQQPADTGPNSAPPPAV